MSKSFGLHSVSKLNVSDSKNSSDSNSVSALVHILQCKSSNALLRMDESFCYEYSPLFFLMAWLLTRPLVPSADVSINL